MAPQIETQFNSHGAAAECIARIGTWHWRAGEDACHWSAGMYGLFGWQIARGARRMPGFEKALTPESWQRLQALAARCGSDGEPFEFVAEARASGIRVETGRVRADMKVSSLNDGPVTIWIDSLKSA